MIGNREKVLHPEERAVLHTWLHLPAGSLLANPTWKATPVKLTHLLSPWVERAYHTERQLLRLFNIYFISKHKCRHITGTQLSLRAWSCQFVEPSHDSLLSIILSCIRLTDPKIWVDKMISSDWHEAQWWIPPNSFCISSFPFQSQAHTFLLGKLKYICGILVKCTPCWQVVYG